MSRNNGLSYFPANFEPLIAGPLDAREIVKTKAELVLPATWITSNGMEYTYLGMKTTVTSDPVADNNGTYRLAALPYTVETNWVKEGSGAGGGTQLKEINVEKTETQSILSLFYNIQNVCVDNGISTLLSSEIIFEAHSDSEVVIYQYGYEIYSFVLKSGNIQGYRLPITQLCTINIKGHLTGTLTITGSTG